MTSSLWTCIAQVNVKICSHYAVEEDCLSFVLMFPSTRTKSNGKNPDLSLLLSSLCTKRDGLTYLGDGFERNQLCSLRTISFLFTGRCFPQKQDLFCLFSRGRLFLITVICVSVSASETWQRVLPYFMVQFGKPICLSYLIYRLSFRFYNFPIMVIY